MRVMERAPSRFRFAGDEGFHSALKSGVTDYFRRTGLSPRGGARMYAKTATILVWFATSYVLLVFAATAWWQGMLFAGSLALAMAGIGFSIQHDANHGAYSKSSVINRILGLTLDAVGASSYVWQWKHNVFHHTYPNLSGADDDIDVGPFARLCPAQPRHPLHRFQRFYLGALYGFLCPKWHFVDDFRNVAQGRIAQNHFPRPRGWSLVQAIGGKAFFLGWAFVIPALFHPLWVVLLFYGATSFLVGVILSIVFQMAHCVEEANSFERTGEAGQVPVAWAVHQVQSTVDFAQNSRLLTWYLGGLNFQIEHHLFPQICHVHYPALSDIVKRICGEYGVRYVTQKNVFTAVRSHWRWLARMGLPVEQP